MILKKEVQQGFLFLPISNIWSFLFLEFVIY